MSIFHVMRFVVYHTIRLTLLTLYVQLNISPHFSQQFVRFLAPETLGEKIQRSSAYIQGFMMVPAKIHPI